MRTVSAVEATIIILVDEKERKFLLTNRGRKALCDHFNVKTTKDLFNDVPAVDLIGPLLIQAQFGEPKDLTDDNIDDLVPVNAEWATRSMLAIVGVSLPDPTPTPAAPVQAE